MTAKAWLVAATVVLAGGGYAAWVYDGHGGLGCCQTAGATGGENPQTAAPDDASLIASQGYCPIMPDTKLGEMGAPIRLMVKGKDGKEEPVFVCCKGCRRKALADPEKTLAKVAELRAVPR